MVAACFFALAVHALLHHRPLAIGAEDEGVQVLYKGTSTGLRNAVKKLIDEIIAQAQHDANHIVPVVELECDSYQHKKYGEIFFPVLEVKRWISIDDAADEAEPAESADQPTADSEEAAPEPAQPARRRRRAAAEQAEAAEPATSSNRRRRRRSAS